MPIYEYQCQECRRRFTLLVGVVAGPDETACPQCGSSRYRKLVSRFARARSEDEVFESLADSAEMAGVDESEPASMTRWMRRMGKEMGEELGDDFEGALDEAEAEACSGESGEAHEGASSPSSE